MYPPWDDLRDLIPETKRIIPSVKVLCLAGWISPEGNYPCHKQGCRITDRNGISILSHYIKNKEILTNVKIY